VQKFRLFSRSLPRRCQSDLPCYPSPFASGEQENALSIESITQQVKEEISKLTQVLRVFGR
jgi:hypothetical protein